MDNKLRLGELLVHNNIITQKSLDKAIEYVSSNNVKIGDALLSLGLIGEDDLVQILSKQLHIRYVDLLNYPIEQDVAIVLPEKVARENKALAIEFKNNKYIVGFVDPLNLESYDVVSNYLQAPIESVIVRNSHILESFDRIYINAHDISTFANELSSVLTSNVDIFSDVKASLDVSSAPVIKLLNSLLSDALKSRASDIHLEPSFDKFRIRLRIDGSLKETILSDPRISNVLIQILKLKSRLNIAETRVPQDGRFDIELYNKKIDVRLSTMPTIYGESAVLRLLDQSKPVEQLTSLGMKPEMANKIYELVSSEHGMLLVTGPTGSGKTTTLYSILHRLNKATRKIITVEDPVEYVIDRINQIQVNYKIDLDFSRVLKSVLRHDPDIIMVGEIRDRETAMIAIRAAITGHLVLATLHTNDALTSAIRLVDIGQEGYMVASALKAILSQRLIRLNCDNCNTTHELSPQDLEWLSKFDELNKEDYSKLKIGKGCTRCHNTGYYGRTAIYELLELNQDMLDALRMDSLPNFVKAARQSKGYSTLLSEAFIQAKQGKVSIYELMRLYGEVEEAENLIV